MDIPEEISEREMRDTSPSPNYLVNGSLPHEDNKPPQQRHETDNIEVFLSRFLKSNIYTNSYDNFFKNKKIKEGISEELKRKVFENSDDGLLALYIFYQTQCRFEYNPMRYSPEIAISVREYIQAIKELQDETKGPMPDRDRIVNADIKRTATHIKVSNSFLQHGIVHTRRQGDFMARLIVVQIGLEKVTYLRPEELGTRAKISAYQNSRT